MVVRVLEPGTPLSPLTAVVEDTEPCPLAVRVLRVCRVLLLSAAAADADARMTELSSWLSM